MTQALIGATAGRDPILGLFSAAIFASLLSVSSRVLAAFGPNPATHIGRTLPARERVAPGASRASA